jgi:hypothetical protein
VQARNLTLDAVATSGAAAPAKREEREAKERLAFSAAAISAPNWQGCYVLRWVSSNGRPTGVTAVRVPTRVSLDTTHAAVEVDPPQFVARDVSPAGERVGGELRWRPLGAGRFELSITRDMESQLFVVTISSPAAQTGRRSADAEQAAPAGALAGAAARLQLSGEHVGC